VSGRTQLCPRHVACSTSKLVNRPLDETCTAVSRLDRFLRPWHPGPDRIDSCCSCGCCCSRPRDCRDDCIDVCCSCAEWCRLCKDCCPTTAEQKKWDVGATWTVTEDPDCSWPPSQRYVIYQIKSKSPNSEIVIERTRGLDSESLMFRPACPRNKPTTLKFTTVTQGGSTQITLDYDATVPSCAETVTFSELCVPCCWPVLLVQALSGLVCMCPWCRERDTDIATREALEKCQLLLAPLGPHVQMMAESPLLSVPNQSYVSDQSSETSETSQD